MKQYYEPLRHTADLAVRIYGKTLEDLFINAAKTIFDITAQPNAAAFASPPILFNIDSNDHEELLVNWLNEILFYFYTEKIICTSFKVTNLTKKHLEIKTETKKITAQSNFIKTEIKSVTFHNVEIEKEHLGGYKVDLILDI